ncbi:MAG: TetR/AcrR family transcriptional regulator [Acidimicrobiia bacterium]|nr:TetR/AcrR family transcriptional regulator [Acidimicrobiia bacterium]
MTQAQDSQPATTDDRIINATISLIGSDGLGAITMSQVAEHAGVARQTLYNHYSDIDSIVAAAVDRHNNESLALLTSALSVAQTPTEKLEQMARHFAMVGAHAGQALEVGSGTSSEVRHAVDKYKHAIERIIQDIIEEGQQTGDFRPDVAMDTDAVLIRSILNGIYELAAAAPEKASDIAASGARMLRAALH